MSRSREFRYTRRDFERARALIRQRAGIALGDSKRDLVYSRLVRRVRAHAFGTVEQYLDYVESTPQEHESFVNALTTNLTSFFREARHFAVLAKYVRELGLPASLRIWCAAASTGEEPYSLAMTLVEAYDAVPSGVRIIATDIDTDVLARAGRGVYPEERLRTVSPAQRARFFLRGKGKNAGLVQVRPELRELVTFERRNLLDSNWGAATEFDVIFCRNVMIYFDKATQRALVRRFFPCLRSGGLLITGHSESLFNASHLFALVGHTVYRKRS